MAVYKNKSNNTWYVSVYYKNWQGSTERKVKRDFKTKLEASEWERTFLLQRSDDVDMTFGAFWELYKADLKEKIRENTWNTKISRNVRTERYPIIISILSPEIRKSYSTRSSSKLATRTICQRQESTPSLRGQSSTNTIRVSKSAIPT